MASKFGWVGRFLALLPSSAKMILPCLLSVHNTSAIVLEFGGKEGGAETERHKDKFCRKLIACLICKHLTSRTASGISGGARRAWRNLLRQSVQALFVYSLLGVTAVSVILLLVQVWRVPAVKGWSYTCYGEEDANFTVISMVSSLDPDIHQAITANRLGWVARWGTRYCEFSGLQDPTREASWNKVLTWLEVINFHGHSPLFLPVLALPNSIPHFHGCPSPAACTSFGCLSTHPTGSVRLTSPCQSSCDSPKGGSACRCR